MNTNSNLNLSKNVLPNFPQNRLSFTNVLPMRIYISNFYKKSLTNIMRSVSGLFFNNLYYSTYLN